MFGQVPVAECELRLRRLAVLRLPRHAAEGAAPDELHGWGTRDTALAGTPPPPTWT